MKISFLVTYYNQKQYVSQSIESILAIRKPCDWEILVGDDGSSDGTQDAVMEYMWKYPEHIFLHVMPRNPSVAYAPVQRASANRINLLEHATGDFYCVLDGDDYYCDIHFLEKALHIFQNHNDIAAVMFGYKYVVDGIDGKQFVLPSQYHDTVVDKGVYLDGLYTPAGACVFRRNNNAVRMQLLKDIGYFDDNDIVIYNMFFGELYCINQVIYAYRQTGSSVYTSMNMVEQSVLNVQGYDIDKQFVDKKYEEALLKRNAIPILTMYLWRKKILGILGSAKYNRYLNECKKIKNSLSYLILRCNDLNREEQKKMQEAVLPLFWKYKKRTVKLLLKKWVQKEV